MPRSPMYVGKEFGGMAGPMAAKAVGTLSNGYTKSGPLPRVAPFRAPIAKLTRALAAHLATITNTPYLGMVFGEHIT